MKKIATITAILLICGLTAYVVATKVESPAQVAARAEAPPAGPVVAEVSQGYLANPVNFSVVAQRQNTYQILPPASLVGVVTAVQKVAGEEVDAGDLLLRANGQPVFILPAQFQLYRDIYPGNVGDDVAALQNGLTAAGFGTGRDRAGTYGPGTQAAVSAMYRVTGYQAPMVPAETATSSVPGSEGQASGSPATIAPSSPTESGPIVRMTEVLTAPQLPAVIESVVAVGARIEAATPVVTVGSGDVILSATVPIGSVASLLVGATGSFVDQAGTPQMAAVVGIASDTAAGLSTLTLAPSSPLADGGNYVVTVDNPSLETGASLLVPVSAVVTRAGRTYIYVESESDSFTEVAVNILGANGGVAAITVAGPDEVISVGTEVRIG